VTPSADPSHARRIRTMFDAVAHRYDLLNHLLSAGVDVRWRRLAVRALGVHAGDRVLDLCTGTGDLALEALRAEPRARVAGIDLAKNMLLRGAAKRGAAGIAFVQGDAEALPFADASVDRASVGFGIRNVAAPRAAFAETARILRPGGRFVVLEFTTPPNRLFRGVYHAYFHRLLPVVGRAVSGHPDAYRYLPDSVSRFPPPRDLAAMLREVGFREVRWRSLHGGIAALHVAER